MLYVRLLLPGSAQPVYGRVLPQQPDEVELLVGDLFAAEPRPSGKRLAFTPEAWQGDAAGPRLLAPIVPGKIIGVGSNYRNHAKEMGKPIPAEPIIFLKPPSALLAPGRAIERPEGFERCDYEGELAVVVGRRLYRQPPSAVESHILGYTVLNDVTVRDLQKRDKQWTRAKGFDGFGPIGPWLRLVPPGTVLPAGALRIQGGVDGVRRQDASLADMVFDVPYLLAYISACMTLVPGDVIYTGTPEGVSALTPGVTTRVELAGWEMPPLENPTR